MTDLQVASGDRVAWMTLDRPPVNALSSSTYEAISRTLDRLAADPDVSVVVVASASDRAFCAGADINDLAALNASTAEEADAQRQQLARVAFDRLLDLPQPTIAVIDGPAIGAGAVLASCCDIRLASSRAWFQLPEVDVGRCGGGRHLMRHLPQGVVRRMYFTGERLPASRAADFGFVELVEPDQDLPRVAAELARTIATKSPLALRLGKEALNRSEEAPVKAGYELEQSYTLRLARSADAREALAARQERREPRFTGH